ncbi:short-subunit dehydrogenase [Bosea sp. BE271]|uniref:SDR family NAD(P)-dependent oxidoreductase n=1 Tax=Bosea TaxID=85413 RepID=UPI002856C5A4|nr:MULTISPECIES: SDR family NAD(P)-dependent oxidoreductase [Bosea]MDR6830783.1 short-subunit dehydrogenase [Bosea robiniae]MDR6895440.1 short-subunit dehydrogenase [Bosea sp. BE109]MDR7138836.1 short-subunit dehydrogenase [Bosea sp. BE168]MDR7175537.1 short-subunit dehydrogenase [Bosea sp. BE271]
MLVTGGSSGIGFALAKILLEGGARVVISGRRGDAVESAVTELAKLGEVSGVAADVTSEAGRKAMLEAVKVRLSGLDILVNNAGGVRAGRLEAQREDEILAMIAVNLTAPILLTRSALPALRASGEAMIVDVASGIALVGAPFYSTYAAVKAGIAHFGEALRRELKGEGIHVLTAFPGGTDTPMMASNRAGPELGFGRESAEAVAQAIVEGIEADALSVVRGGEARAQMIALNRADPAALDARFLGLKPALEEAVRDHAAL